MTEQPGSARRGDDAPVRRRRSSMTPRQRRKLQRAREQQEAKAAARRSSTDATSSDPSTGTASGTSASGTGRRRRSSSARPTAAASEPASTAPRRSSPNRASRSRARAGRGRRLRPILTVLITLVVTGAIGATIVLTGLYDRALDLIGGGADEPEERAVVPIDERQPSAIIVTYDEQAPSAEASRVMVLGVDRETGEGTVLLVPTATVVDVPGRGSFELGEAHSLGGGQLVGASLENLLGARFDGTIELSVQGWASLLERTDGYSVDVRSRLVQHEDDGGQVRFEAGQQFLDGPRLAEYLAFRAQGESQLEALLRVQQVINGLLDRIVAEPELVDRMFADDAPMVGAEDPQLLRTLLEELAGAREADQLTVLTLPVSPLAGGEDVYQADEERMERLVDEHFSASRPTGAVGAGRSLQILNGNGAPGIGEDVAQVLRDGGYRIVLTGNADNFDYDATRIIVYEESSEQVAIAQDIQERLGVGEIVRSEVPQSVVDITIVVGHDFLE